MDQHSGLDRAEEHERRRALLMDWLYGQQPDRCSCPMHPHERRGDGRPSRQHTGCRWAHLANRALRYLLHDLARMPADFWDKAFSNVKDAVDTGTNGWSVAS